MANHQFCDYDYRLRFSLTALVVSSTLGALEAIYLKSLDNGPYTILGFFIRTIIGTGIMLVLLVPISLLLRRLYIYNPFWLPWLLNHDRYGYHWYPDVANWLRARGYALNQAPIVLEETEGPTNWRAAHVSDTKIMARRLWQEMLSRDM